MEQILGFFLFPLFFGFMHTAARHQGMNMGVIIQAPVMRQNRSQADVGAKIFGFKPNLSACWKRRQKEGYKRGLEIRGQGFELIGKRKGSQELLTGKSFLFWRSIQSEVS